MASADSKTAYVAVMGGSDIAVVNLENGSVDWINGVGNGPRPSLVDDQREDLVGRVGEQRRCIVADETRVGAGDPGQCLEQHGERGRPGPRRGVLELVASSVDRADQPHGRLGALGVAAEPEEVFGRAGGKCLARRGRRKIGFRWPELATARGFGAEHPGVLRVGPDAIRDRRPRIVAGDPGEPARHRDVGVAGGDGEGAQHGGTRRDRTIGERRRRAGRQPFLADPLIGLRQDPPPDMVELGGAGAGRVDRVLEGGTRQRAHHQ